MEDSLEAILSGLAQQLRKRESRGRDLISQVRLIRPEDAVISDMVEIHLILKKEIANLNWAKSVVKLRGAITLQDGMFKLWLFACETQPHLKMHYVPDGCFAQIEAANPNFLEQIGDALRFLGLEFREQKAVGRDLKRA